MRAIVAFTIGTGAWHDSNTHFFVARLSCCSLKQIVGCDWCEATIHEACYEDELYTRNNGRGSKRWQRKSRERATGVLNASVERLRHLADGGLDKLKDAWEKIKAAAEETADAASRPRHW